MKQLNCLIIDDEPLARNGLASYCEEISFLNVVGLCKNALQANDLLHEHVIDVIFLDINMPLLSGLEWLKTLDKSPLVVMTTAYSEHALESFKYEVIDYLIKPISFNRFLQAVNKAYRLSDTNTTEKVFFIKSDRALVKVITDSILFIEAMQNYIKIILEDNVIIAHTTLKQIKENLNEVDFIQTHKSFIISKSKIKSIDGNQVLISDYKVPISVRMKKEVMEKIIG